MRGNWPKRFPQNPCMKAMPNKSVNLTAYWLAVATLPASKYAVTH